MDAKHRSFIIFLTILYTIDFGLNCLVVTPLGGIEGTTVYHDGKPIEAFLGIPFAKPPVGNLRFRKPIPVNPWVTVRQAKSFAPSCIQYVPLPYPWKADDLPGSEDCLYLNVWVPMGANIFNKKSVMFWIYGGGYTFGSSRTDFYHGQVLAAEGDVIVVTFNYRIGVEGFFYAGTDDAPGNMGMFDMVEALKWVRNNIEYFGGDRNSITIFGHSAGAISAGMFTVSPITQGLFRRIIMQSAAPTNLDAEDNDRTFQTSEELAKKVGCASDDDLRRNPRAVVKCMRKQDAVQFAVLLANITAGKGRSFYPRFGDEFLPKNPRLAIIDDQFLPVDVLIGTNSGDGALLITQSMINVFGFFGEKYPQINRTFGAEIIRNNFKQYPDPDAVVSEYLDGLQENDDYAVRYEVFTATGDYRRHCPAVYFAEKFSQKANVFYYFFIHRPSNSPWAPWMLAVHHDETPFVFGYPLRYPQNYTSEELDLSRRLIQAWSSFAKTGKPEAGTGTWPVYSTRSHNYQVLNISDIDATGNGPHLEKCNFFRATFGF